MADDLDELKRRLRTYTKGWHPGVEEMREQAADALDRLTASLAAKDAEIANLRTDLKVKEIATDEAMAQGERQRAEIEGLRVGVQNIEILLDIDGDSPTPQEVGAAHKEALRLLALSQSPAGFQARREAERKVIEAAKEWRRDACVLSLDRLCRKVDALAALAEQEAKGPHGG